jgi:hypothetical protein
MVKLTNMLVEPRAKKKQAIILLNSLLYAYIHYFCDELALYLVFHGASKNFILSFMVQVKQLGVAS